MEYKETYNLTGAVPEDNFDKKIGNTFRPSQPTTWPNPPDKFNPDFYETIKKIFNESMMHEIKNVLDDIKKCSQEGLQHRGHVVAIVLLCAVDTISSYAYLDGVGCRYKNFIKIYFPKDYRPYANRIYKLYRNSMVHGWNLLQASMLPGEEPIRIVNGIVRFGLLNFYSAIKFGLNDFLTKLERDVDLQKSALDRYKELKEMAK